METPVEVVCPYCGELVTLFIEVVGQEQKYWEDCEVCCRPLRVHIHMDHSHTYHVQVHRSSGH